MISDEDIGKLSNAIDKIEKGIFPEGTEPGRKGLVMRVRLSILIDGFKEARAIVDKIMASKNNPA